VVKRAHLRCAYIGPGSLIEEGLAYLPCFFHITPCMAASLLARIVDNALELEVGGDNSGF
jgi:hypothetical protein